MDQDWYKYLALGQFNFFAFHKSDNNRLKMEYLKPTCFLSFHKTLININFIFSELLASHLHRMNKFQKFILLHNFQDEFGISKILFVNLLVVSFLLLLMNIILHNYIHKLLHILVIQLNLERHAHQ